MVKEGGIINVLLLLKYHLVFVLFVVGNSVRVVEYVNRI